MAVDFSLLPQEDTQHVEAPSRFLWAIAFFLMLLAGGFAVLLLWPKDIPTQTSKFWITLTLFPVGIPTWIVLRRYSVHEGRKLDIALRNEALRAFNDRVFEAASIPLAILGAAHRISSDPRVNAPERIKEGSVTLNAQDPIAKYGDVVTGRWITVPGTQNTAGGEEIDLRRRHHVTTWLFNQLLDDLLPTLEAIPSRVPLSVHLSIANGFAPEANEALWLDCWDKRTTRSIEIIQSTTLPSDLIMLDQWMDAIIGNEDIHTTLIVTIQLNPLLAATPSDGTAEAGVAVLLAPDALASRYSLARQCNLHRPVRGTVDQPGESLSHALQWANTTGDRVTTAWQTGLDAAQAGSLGLPARKLALNPRITNLDQTVGNTGRAAPWLALACAASTPRGELDKQIIFSGQGTKVDCAVLVHSFHINPIETL